MDLRSLEVFVWVTTLGSFRGAAARLNTTQPAISQRIAGLEADLGVRLLERSRRGVAPTDRGRVLLAGAERILTLTASLRAAVGDPDTTRGTLRLGVAETVVHTWLPRFLEQVSRDYPRLAIEVEVDITPVLAGRLEEREIDLAFLLGPLPDPGVRNLPICSFPMAFLASPALGLPAEPLRRADLAGLPLITFARRTRPYSDLMRLAAVPEAIAREQLVAGSLRVVSVHPEARLPDLAFTASWPVAPAGVVAEALAATALAVAGSTTNGPPSRDS